MRYCPHCRKPTVAQYGDCPHCGHDLDLGPLPSNAGADAGYEALSGLDSAQDDHLELDISYTGPPDSSYMTDSMSPPPSAVGSIPVLPSFSNEEEILEFDMEELENIARYGDVPRSLVDTVLYAFRVRSRTAELKTEASRLEKSLAQAKIELMEHLARLGERARVAGYMNKMIAPLLAEVAAADRDAESAEDAVATEKRRHRREIEAIEAQIEELRTLIEAPRLKESKLAGRMGALEEQRRQIENRLKRCEIEIRNAEAAIARADAAKANPEVNPELETLQARANKARNQLPQLQASRQQLRTQNAQLDEPLGEIKQQLEHVRAHLGQLKGRRSDLLEARKKEEALHLANTQGASTQSQQAQEVARIKLAEIGRAVRLDRNAPEWAEELFVEIDTKANTFNGLRTDHQRFLRASECFDSESVKKGYLILGGGAGLIFAAILAVITLLASFT